MIDMTPMEMKLDTIEEQYPLSAVQQSLLFQSLSEPESGVNCVHLVCDLQEALNVPAFRDAWQQVVEQHPMLRTSFRWEGVQEPLQKVNQHIELSFENYDWRNLSAAEIAEQLTLYLQNERKRGFQLNEPPLLRLALFQIAENYYKFVWTFHLILLDSQSSYLVLQDLFSCYEALCFNQNWQPSQPRPYWDYIQWLLKQEFTGSEEFWSNQLRGLSAPTPLIVERDRSALSQRGNRQTQSDEFQHAQQDICLSETLTSKLQFFVKEHQLQFNTLIQGAWALLLSRYSGEPDVVFGLTKVCRPSALEEAELMVGRFSNTLPLRVHVDSEMLLLQWLQELQQQNYALQNYEYTSLSEIKRWSGLPTGQLIFESTLSVESASLNSKLFAKIYGKQRTLQLLEETNIPLRVTGYLEPEFLLQISYNRNRFEEATITRMLGHLQTLLEGIVTHPEQQLKDLPLLTAAERNQLLVEWNNTQAAYPNNSCIHHLFEAQVEQTPDAVAVVFEEQSLTYRELNILANQLAHYLQNLGVKPDTLVAISVERSLEMVVGFLGILKAGGAYIPLDPAYPHERRAYKIQDSQTPIILTQERLLTSLPENNAQVVCLDTDWEIIAQQSSENPVSETTVENLSYVIYTSGSTGKPKGVLITHQGMVNHSVAIAHQYQLKPTDRVLQFSSMSFDIIIEELFPSLITGAAVILRPENILSSTLNFVQFIAQERISILNLPTAFWHELVNGLSALKTETGNTNVRDDLPLLATVRLVIVGGEKASRATYLTWLELIGQRIHWLNTYGPTETTVTATLYDPSVQADSDYLQSEIPIGRPLANVQVYILDPNLQPVPIGVPGELHIGGAGLGRGYLNRSDLTASKFISNPFSDNVNARLYKTGDTVRYLNDGNIEFVGRIDYQVKIRGFRIELGEIETVIEQHPNVQQAVVLAREDVPGNKRLVAYVVPKSEQFSKTGELRSFLKERLPEYMVPAVFIMLESLPLTPNGKVDRRALNAPDPTVANADREIVAPRYQLEFQLTKMWEEILGIEPIGIKDNFFELGGHSLLVMRLIAQIHELFGKNLPINTVFLAPTVEQLAKLIYQYQEEGAAPWRSLVPLQTQGSKPPFFCVHEIIGNAIYCQRMARYLPDQPLYGLQPVGLEGTQTPHTRIEEMAAHYIQEMQTVEPNGPYFLGGYSFGGLVAFEMARQLKAQGKTIAFLGLFDAHAPGYKKLVFWRWLLKKINYTSQNGFQILLNKVQSQLFGKPKPETINAELASLTQHLHLDSQKSIDHSIELVTKVNFQAIDYYAPKPYCGQATLFRATLEEPSEGWKFDPYLGWKKLVNKGIEIQDIPAIHIRMFDEPNVKIVAEKLRDCLDKAHSSL